MPLVDKPLAELKTYLGSSPCPKDIDAFWDNALSEMKAIDPKVELIPSEFKSGIADCYDMYFTGVGGARVYAKLLKPKKATSPHPAVVMFHGYTGSSGSWVDKLSYVSQGYTVAALDCRGQGGKSEDNSNVKGNTFRGHIIRGVDSGKDDLLFKKIYLDTAQLAGLVMDMEDVDENRVGCLGGSQGGALTIACASLEPRIKRAAPMYPFLCDYKRVWDMDLAKGAYQELKDYFRAFDPLHKREDEVFDILSYIDLQNISHRIDAEVMMQTGLMDEICPPSTQFAMYNKITSNKRVMIYPDFGHENLPGGSDATFTFMLGL